MGYFITIEGGEGAGKSTQMRLLAEFFTQKGYAVETTREPGGTAIAEKIRKILLDLEEVSDPLVEFLLLTAARRDHVEAFIKPELALGKVIICDRFVDSSLVYQGIVKDLDRNIMEAVNTIVLKDFRPDYTILIDIDPAISTRRLLGRSTVSSHYDEKDLEFHRKIRQGFLELAKTDPARFIIIDGSLSIENVSKQINAKLNELFHQN